MRYHSSFILSPKIRIWNTDRRKCFGLSRPNVKNKAPWKSKCGLGHKINNKSCKKVTPVDNLSNTSNLFQTRYLLYLCARSNQIVLAYFQYCRGRKTACMANNSIRSLKQHSQIINDDFVDRSTCYLSFGSGQERLSKKG